MHNQYEIVVYEQLNSLRNRNQNRNRVKRKERPREREIGVHMQTRRDSRNIIMFALVFILEYIHDNTHIHRQTQHKYKMLLQILNSIWLLFLDRAL